MKYQCINFCINRFFQIRKISIYINVNEKRKIFFFKIQEIFLNKKRQFDFFNLFINEQKKIKRVRFLKLFQDVEIRWNFTCHILIKIHLFRAKIEQFCVEWHVKYLRLNDDEWSQIEYLIELLKSFCFYIKILNIIKKFIIQSMYKIYNRLFEHLKRVDNKFSRKKVSWKQTLKNELKATHAKLQKYYEQTHDELKLLYEKAILLHFIVDDAIFNTFDWKKKTEQKF